MLPTGNAVGMVVVLTQGEKSYLQYLRDESEAAAQ